MSGTAGFQALGDRWPLVQPVVHVTSREQALAQADLCRQVGSDGVFLIGHGIAARSLRPIVSELIEEVGGFVGVNYLDRDAADVLADPPSGGAPDGVWADNLGRVADEGLPGEGAPLFYGGFAFKYQRQPEDLVEEAKACARLCDVVTTSGTGTGSAPNVNKLEVIRQAIPDHPVAIASGVTPANAPVLLPWVDAVLVATGISRSFDEIDPDALTALLWVRDHVHAGRVPR